MDASASDNDLWVFRDGRKTVAGKPLLDDLQHSLQVLSSSHAESSHLLNTLIRSGELEAALSDAASSAAPQIATVTDALADAFYGSPPFLSIPCVLNISVPAQLELSPPEGFSYYALHPADFGRLALQSGTDGRPAAVIGVRSIGTTLSAVVSAALRSTRIKVQRITVRPNGHPYDRVLQFTDSELLWIRKHYSEGSQFLIVDEGPGRSGSTFLAVAEALVCAGVEISRITLLGSRQPDLSQLCSHDGACRWSRFRFVAVEPDLHSRFRDYTYIGGGEWRRYLLAEKYQCPATWPQMERLKFLSPDGKRFWKFDGLGRFGEDVLRRSQCLASSGFGVDVQDGGDGFSSYSLIQGKTLSPQDLSRAILDRLSEYCAFRASEFRGPDAASESLTEMVTYNVQQELGVDPRLHPEELAAHPPIIADGRMQPHEWLLTQDGRILKTDASTHGNDHFFPGPCDIAWDLAGAAIEWDLQPEAINYLVAQFSKKTGDAVQQRFSAYRLAYSVFRFAWCKMALTTVRGTEEEPRLQQAYIYYRQRAEHEIMQRQNSATLQSANSAKAHYPLSAAS